jgi:hypothetical protein
MAAAAGGGGGAAAQAGERRPRPAHPDSLDECLFVTPLEKEWCCSLCFDPFKQARTRSPFPLAAAR